MFNSLCACANTKSAYVSVCMYFFPLIRFLPKRLTDYVSLRMFVCLTTTLLGSIYLQIVFTVIASLILWYNPYYHQLSPINFYFIFSFVHSGSIQDIKFARHGLPLPVPCMRKPFEVNINYFVRLVLQRVTFCFCLFFWRLSLFFIWYLLITIVREQGM